MTSTRKIIMLDPGHGLNSKGKYKRPLMDCRGKKVKAISGSMNPHPNDKQPGFYREDHGTLAIAEATAEELENLGHIVFMTREDDNGAYVHLSSQSNNSWKKKYWRAWKWVKDYTAKKNADIFVSIHTNASESGKGNGVTAFWADPVKGRELCEALVREIHSEFGLKIRPPRKKAYAKTKNTCHGRACLIECLFHDYMDDVKHLLTPQGITRMGKAIAKGLHKYAQTF